MKNAGALSFAGALLLLLATAHAGAVIPCNHWPKYMQCDSRWGSTPLGTSTVDTICSAGCAMTSTTMSLAHFNTSLHGAPVNPGSLNKWLIDHGGYVDTDLIVWNSVKALGTMELKEDVNSMSPATLQKYVDKCHPVIVHVRDATHFVLVIGYDSEDDQTYYVNDPAFPVDTYQLDGMSQFVVYGPQH